jgi:hypothetical protein
MMTEDLKMQVLHFNKVKSELEIISLFCIDKQILGGGKSLKQLREVIYTSYDKTTQTMIVVFQENYVLTVNLSPKR